MDGKISRRDKPCQVSLEELVVDIPPPLYSQELITSQQLQVEDNEQYNGNGLLLHQEVTIEKII